MKPSTATYVNNNMNLNHITAIAQCFGISEPLATIAIEIYRCGNDVCELHNNADGTYIWAKGMKSAPTKDELRDLLAAKVLMKDHTSNEAVASIYTYELRREAHEVIMNVVWNEWTEARISADYYPIRVGSVVYAIDCFTFVENEDTMAMAMAFRPLIEGKVINFTNGGLVQLECDSITINVMLSDIYCTQSNAQRAACEKLGEWLSRVTN